MTPLNHLGLFVIAIAVTVTVTFYFFVMCISMANKYKINPIIIFASTLLILGLILMFV